MNNEQCEKAPRWIWKIMWLLIIIGILGIMSSFLPKSLPSWETSWFAKTNNESCHFSPGQTKMTIVLEPNKWSCRIVIPPSTDYRVDSDQPNTKICFWDGYCSKVGPVGPGKWFGVRQGVFQLLSQEKGTATITIERR